MHKKAISPLISAVLLIGLTVAVVTLIATYSKDLFITISESTQTELQQFQIERQLDLIIQDATSQPDGGGASQPLEPVGSTCSTQSRNLIIEIVNNADLTIDKLIIQKYKTDNTIELIDSSFPADIQPFAFKELAIPYIDGCNTDYFRLIPKINNEATNYKLDFTPKGLPR